VKKKKKPETRIDDKETAVAAMSTLVDKLEALDREPFRNALASILGVKPTKQSLQKFANRSPDRWAQAISVLGVLSGFERGAVVSLNFYDVKRMTDAQLMGEASKFGITIEGTVGKKLEGEELPKMLGAMADNAQDSRQDG
jgi:hypothetical protein